jgi:hypothetical protein
MILISLKNRLEKLEQAKGEGTPNVFMVIQFDEDFTPEELAALDAYEEKMKTVVNKGCFAMIMRTSEKAQELLSSSETARKLQ